MLGGFHLAFTRGSSSDEKITPQLTVERTFVHSFGFSGHVANLRWVARRFKGSDGSWSILKIHSNDGL
jgi:hypothetical protein